MGVDHGGGRAGAQVPPPLEFGAGIVPQILSCCKILSTRLLALQCRKMCFLPLQQDFYSKSGHASPQNSSQIYAYDPPVF